MSGSQLAVPVLLGIAVAELMGLVVLVVLLLRARRTATRWQHELQLAQRAGTRRGKRTAAERAVKAVLGTAVRVRDQGVGGLVMSSLDDLSRWAKEDRAEIARVAAPDGTVTIFFSDIEDSTAWTEQLGDSRWVGVLEAHDALVRTRVDRHGGHVVKSQGDGFMVVFRAPQAAVRAAVSIQRTLAGARGRRLRRAPIQIRIGVHVGTAVWRDHDYFGRNVAMAARVAAQAAGGEILISDDVRRALDVDEFALDPAGEAELKGLADVHALWTVAWSD